MMVYFYLIMRVACRGVKMILSAIEPSGLLPKIKLVETDPLAQNLAPGRGSTWVVGLGLGLRLRLGHFFILFFSPKFYFFSLK